MTIHYDVDRDLLQITVDGEVVLLVSSYAVETWPRVRALA